MAQGMLTNYFAGAKRSDPFQPSKRRKVLRSNAKDDSKLSFAVLPDLKFIDAADVSLKQNSEALTPDSSQCKLTLKPEPVSKTKSRATSKSNASTTNTRSTRSRASKQKTVTHGPMDKVLARSANKNSQKNAEAEKKVSKKPPSSTSSEDSEVTSVSDDHDALLSRSQPGTPTKRSKKNSEAPIRRKRRKPILSDANEAEDTEKVVTEVKPETSSRSKRSAGSRSKASVKKSLDKTFQKYENKEQSTETEPVKTEVNEDTEQASNRKQIVQSKNPVNAKLKEHTRTKPKSKSTLQKLAEQSQSTASSAPEDSKNASNPLGERIRATLKNQMSPVKLELPASTSSASKEKLTPAMVRDRLSKSGKLAELQSRLAKIKECADQAKKESKVATKVKPAAKKTEEKSKPSSSMPAYQKYHSLASPAPPSLTLPFKYKTLEQMFHSVDTVVSLLHNRKETCTFPKLKTAVQEMCRKTFELRNVGQIKNVYPTSYFFNQQKQTIKQRQAQGNKSEGGYELAVQPNLDSNGMSSTAPDSSEVSSQAMKGATSSLLKKFTPSMLIARRTIFHNSLIDIVKEHHKTFLSKLDRPLSVPDDKLTRWHPKFPLDTIPEVESSALPQPPVVKTYCNAKDVLDKARDMMTPRVAKALETVAKNSAMLKSAKLKSSSSSSTLSKLAPQSSKEQGSSSKGQSSALAGVNQSLLERIRAKEAQKQVAVMMRDPEDEKKIERLERLPELCRIVRVYFLSEKKGALIYDAIVKKVGDSCKSTLSKPEVEKHLDLMIEILPHWLTVHNIRKEKYIKMNKKEDINDIISKVNKIYKETK